jgi:hypothetical protein
VILSNSDALLAAALFGAAGAGGLYCLWPHMRWGIYVITGLMILASDRGAGAVAQGNLSGATRPSMGFVAVRDFGLPNHRNGSTPVL